MKKSLLFLASVLFIASCKKEKIEQNFDTFTPREVKISQNVKVVDESTNLLLTSLDTSKVVFSAQTTYLSDLQVGDIIVSGIAPTAPEGYLGEVTSIVNNGGVIEVNMVKSDLSSIVIDGAFNFERELNPDNIRASSFTHNFNEVLYDRDGNYATLNDQIKLTGAVSLNPTLILDADWRGFMNLDMLKMGVKINQTNNFQLTGNVDLPPNYIFEKEVYRKPLKPIQFTIGYVPVVINPIVVIKVGIDGEANVSFNVTYDDSHTLTTYVKKPSGVSLGDFGNWTNHFSVNTDYQNFNPNNIADSMNNIDIDLEIPYVWGGVEFYLYNYSGARSRLLARAALDLQAGCNVTANCNASLDLKLKTCIDAYLRIFRKTLVDHEFCLLDKTFPIWSYSNAPLVAHYPLDGNANDVSGNAKHGVLNGAYGAYDRNGNAGKALFFDGVNDDVEINHSLLSSSNNTITFWAKPSYTYNSTGSNYFFDAATPSNPLDRYLLYKNDAVGLTNYGGGSNLGSLTVSSPSWWKTNQWMHFAVTYDSGNNESKLYVDGVLIHTFTGTWSSKNPSTFFLGKRFTPFTGSDYERFKGYMDDLRIYREVLTPSEISDLYLN